MAGFENYVEDSREIEQEIERKGIALGINWADESQVRLLAKEALDHLQDDVKLSATDPLNFQLLAKVELFGLAGLMLKTMAESANYGIASHGGDAWKAFAKALWTEAELRK